MSKFEYYRKINSFYSKIRRYQKMYALGILNEEECASKVHRIKYSKDNFIRRNSGK